MNLSVKLLYGVVHVSVTLVSFNRTVVFR